MKTVHLPVEKDYWALVKYEANRLEITVPFFIIRCIDKYFEDSDMPFKSGIIGGWDINTLKKNEE